MKQIAVMLLLVAATSMTVLARPVHDVPEIDPGSVVSGSALLCAAVVMVRGRRKA